MGYWWCAAAGSRTWCGKVSEVLSGGRDLSVGPSVVGWKVLQYGNIFPPTMAKMFVEADRIDARKCRFLTFSNHQTLTIKTTITRKMIMLITIPFPFFCGKSIIRRVEKWKKWSEWMEIGRGGQG